MGVRYEIPGLLGGYLTPYLELSAGLQVFRLWILFNQMDDESIWAKVPSVMIDRNNYYGLLSLEGGFTVLPEELLVFGDTSVQIEAFGGLNVILGGSTWDISYYRYFHRYWTEDDYVLEDKGFASRLIPYFGAGIKLGFDL